MAVHRRLHRRGTEARTVGSGTAEDALSPRQLARGEPVEEAPGEPGEPAGFGTEAATTATADVVLDSYRVPENRTARLVEVSVAIPTDGEASVHVNGTTYGPFTGQVDVTLPFGEAFLLPGSTVKVTHESTTGSSVTTKATVTAREV